MAPARGDLQAITKRVVPFAATAVAAWVVVLIGSKVQWGQYSISVALLVLSWGYGIAGVLRGHNRSATVVGAFGFLAAVGFLRQATGGSTSGISVLALLPVFQTALYVRDRRALGVVLVAVAAFYLVPVTVVGPPLYPHTSYRSGLLSVAVSAIIGLVTHGLVADIRTRAAEARQQTRMLVRVNETVQQLTDSQDVRSDLCKALVDISGAALATIFEAPNGTGPLRCTGSTIPGAMAVVPDPTSGASESFRSGRVVFVNEESDRRAAAPLLWHAGGRPASVLCQPLHKDGERIGVVVAGWSEVLTMDDSRVLLASLLARDAGHAIGVADAIGDLAEEAQTDPLTGLPNRRAWDARLGHALAQGSSFAIAILDIDRFKQFNDTRGHPAGDSLLADSADCWRAELRVGDFLARLGGEEFGVLLPGLDRDATLAVVNRLIGCMPLEQTCSAGVSFSVHGDTADDLFSRADQALYRAKAEGRNRLVLSGATAQMETVSEADGVSGD